MESIEQRIDFSVRDLLVASGHRQIGRLRPRRTTEISGSPWSIGCETLDRDYVDFAHTGPHLADLGAKHARVQAGWAKCDPKGDGSFEWEWLDAIVDGCLKQGVRPWLQTSYGNPTLPGGGGIGLAEGLPTSDTALAAWDRWVRAMVARYQDRVTTWEIWNEPDIHNAATPEEYATLLIRTATIIRSVQPRATVAGVALAGNVDFAAGVLRHVHAEGKSKLMDEVVYHFYPHNPDESFGGVARLAELIKLYAPHATLRQGETGAPSETLGFLALGKFEWNERKQAVWNSRRLLAHHARGIPMNLFQLADMQYTTARGAKFEGRNPKGLLCINTDKTVAYRKPSYTAAQSVFSIFDDRFACKPLPRMSARASFDAQAYTWHDATGPAVVGWWRSDIPPELTTPALESISSEAVGLADAVLVDVLSGSVFGASTIDFTALPCSDSPLLLVRHNVLAIQEAG